MDQIDTPFSDSEFSDGSASPNKHMLYSKQMPSSDLTPLRRGFFLLPIV